MQLAEGQATKVPATARDWNRSNSLKSFTIPSSCTSKFTGEFGFVRIIKKRSTSGGSRFAMSRALAPRPLLDDIFAPPTRKNSYGTRSGGSVP